MFRISRARRPHRRVGSTRDDRWKLLLYPRINKVQFFDLAEDPAEMKDLTANRMHASEVKRLTALLGEWQKRLGDTLPLHSDKPEPLEFDFRKVPQAKGP